MELSKLTSESWQFIIDYTEKLPQGVLLHYKGCPYPRRVYYDKKNDINFPLRVLNALGVVKKYLFALTYLKNVVIPYRFSVAKYEAFLIHLYHQFEWTLAEFMIKDDEYSVPVWEIGKFIRVFLQELGLSEYVATAYSRIAMMILEFDNAYRYRAQDLLGETTKELLQNARKEITRLLAIYDKREDPAHYFKDGARSRVKTLAILKTLLLIPKVKKAFLTAVSQMDLDKVKFDANDRFHFSFWNGYDFEGKNFEERFSPYQELYTTIPFTKREDPHLTADFMTGVS